jgi:phosphotransferase system enzyme I (PtsP)
MVRKPSEVLQTKALLRKLQEELGEQDIPQASHVKIGVMLEVPVVVFSLSQLRPLVDYISVGSNDLLQYAFASARDGMLPPDALFPSALRLLKHIVVEATALDLPVTVCGDIAGDTLGAMALLGLGYTKLSMPQSKIAPIRTMVETLDIFNLKAYVDKALTNSTLTLREQLRFYALDHGLII